jgi:uncharacterized protein (UPF0332 family)
MDKALKALASARLLLAASDTDGATNRAYYAMFDAAIAALSWAGADFAQPNPWWPHSKFRPEPCADG